MQYDRQSARAVGENFQFFFGYIVDIDDPRKAGRVKCMIIGAYTPNLEPPLENEDLPWIQVAAPTLGAGMSGVGTFPHGFRVGSWVYGAFRDGDSYQEPIILGAMPGWMVDPEGDYPRPMYSNEEDEFLDPDVNLLARGPVGDPDKVRYLSGDHPIWQQKAEKAMSDVATAFGKDGTWSEPPYAYDAKYPYNQVTETEQGHIFEVDDTPGAERQHRWHPTGTYEEIDKEGTVVTKVVKDNYTVIMGADYCYVKGTVNLTIDSDCNTKIKGDWNVEVGGNTKFDITGNLDIDAKRIDLN